MKNVEGFLAVEGGNVWYQILGEKRGIPLILIHGGPGYPHNYLEPLKDLSDDRQVILYDQLGCGNSDTTTDPSLWTLDQFVLQLQKLIEHLGLDEYHILGQSWGATIAVAYALTKPQGLISLILSDAYVSTPQWLQDATRLIALLPEDMQLALQSGDKESVEYKNASKEYYSRYVTRADPSPEEWKKSAEKMNREMYQYMWGTEEFCPTGTLLDLDLTPRFSKLTLPVLLLCGRYDEATPEAAERYHELLPQSQVQVFEDSAHYPFWNETEAYNQTVREFLEKTS
jgi:proline-specific peptidase